jgi:prolyl oligopeptidase
MEMKIFLLGALCAGISCYNAHAQGGGKLMYPKARKANVSDNYFGTKVADPYRWMENDTSAEVKTWVDAENRVTQDYLAQVPYRKAIHDHLTDIWNYTRYTAPIHKGKHYFFYKNDGLQNQSVMYKQEKTGGKSTAFFDPNNLSKDGTVSLGGTFFSKDGTKMGYTISRSGSDWQEIYVMDVNTGKRTTDSIRWAKFTEVAWQGDGFYYSRFDEPVSGSSGLSAQNVSQKIFFHKLGTPQSQDIKVFEDPARPKVGYGASTTEDESYVLVGGSEGASSGNELFYRKASDAAAPFKKLNSGFEYNFNVINNIGDKFLVLTDKGASRYRLVLVDLAKPDESNWTTVIPEKTEVLQSVTQAGGKIFAHYMKDASARVHQYDMSGKEDREITLPGLGNASGFDGEKQDKDIYYSYTSFTYPTTIFKYNIASGKSTVYIKPDVKFNPDDYETKQVFYPSKDGVMVPMFVVHKKGIPMDGQNPTMLYGYGGFNISLYPDFSVSRMILLEKGGIYAVATLRGGGEYGEDWHKAGMLNRKQNVFNDFIGAAEYLIQNQYTSREKLAISGRSNGGLLVGACMTQRPDLFKVAYPGVGVLDMLRFHKFTIGYAWASEYGSSDDSSQFKFLYAYSPLHNLKEISYPATMITTADHDDRVVPAHSFKFAATLQEKQQGDNPVLIRIDSKAGHGGGKPTAKQIDEWTDIWSFMFYNMGVKY